MMLRTLALEFLVLATFLSSLPANAEDKTLIISLKEDPEKSDAIITDVKSDVIITDLKSDAQFRSERYLPAHKEESSSKYSRHTPMTGLVLNKELSYVLLRPEDAKNFKLNDVPDESDKTPRYFLIPENDVTSYNRSSTYQPSYRIPLKDNTISVEVVRDKDSVADYNDETQKYPTRAGPHPPPAKESSSLSSSPYVTHSDSRSPIEPITRKTYSPGVIPPLPPMAPRSPLYIHSPGPRYYYNEPYSSFPPRKLQYGPPAPNFAGPRLYPMPPPGPFRGLFVRGPPIYHPHQAYNPGPPILGAHFYSPQRGNIRGGTLPPPPPSGNAIRGGQSPEILLPVLPPGSSTKTNKPPYYTEPSTYGKNNRDRKPYNEGKYAQKPVISSDPSYYGVSGPSSYGYKPPSTSTGPSKYTGENADFYHAPKQNPPIKDYSPVSHSKHRPPSLGSTDFADPPHSHPTTYTNYKPNSISHTSSNSYVPNPPSMHGDKLTTYTDNFQKYPPETPGHSDYPKDSPSSYGPSQNYHKDSHSSHGYPSQHTKESYYGGPSPDYPKDSHSSYKPIPDHSKNAHSSYGPPNYEKSHISSYSTPTNHLKNSHSVSGHTPEYSKDSHSPYGSSYDSPKDSYPPYESPSQYTKDAPSSYDGPSSHPAPPYDSYERPSSYFTEEDAVSSPGPHRHPNSFQPAKKPLSYEMEKQPEYAQSLDISSEVPDYHKAKKNYEPVRPPPRSSLRIKKLYPPLPPPRKAHVYSSDEEEGSKENHHDHHYHYDHHHKPQDDGRHYSAHTSQTPSHSNSHSGTSYSSSSSHADIPSPPHSAERTYYSSSNIPGHYHSEPVHHSSEEIDNEAHYHDKPAAASKPYTHSAADHNLQYPASHYKSYPAPNPSRDKPRYTDYPEDSNYSYQSKYPIEPPSSQTSMHIESLPTKSKLSSEDESEMNYNPKKYRKRLRLNYGIKPVRPQKLHHPKTPAPQAGYTGVWQTPTTTYKPYLTQPRYVASDKENYNRPLNSYEDSEEIAHVEDSKAAIPGQPGKDYPILERIPVSNFDCYNKAPGFYADIENRCQVYYQCSDKGRVQSFLCPNGTIFNQETFVCEWWHNVDCSKSERHFARNNDLYKVPEPKYPKQQYPPSRGRSPGYSGIKKLKYYGPPTNAHQPYRESPPAYSPVNHRSNDQYDQTNRQYEDVRSSDDYELHGSATENKKEFINDDSEIEDSQDDATSKKESIQKDEFEDVTTEVFGAKRIRKGTHSKKDSKIR